MTLQSMGRFMMMRNRNRIAAVLGASGLAFVSWISLAPAAHAAVPTYTCDKVKATPHDADTDGPAKGTKNCVASDGAPSDEDELKSSEAKSFMIVSKDGKVTFTCESIGIVDLPHAVHGLSCKPAS
ncbi:hypothetical protein ACIA8C_04035 [Nocardia sp. NPDC051321]|uniref:hypothetical protein n=1 Tax=Nocardia sp. NPDC051321 TaxID=3364323 RepID=UPI00378B0FF6